MNIGQTMLLRSFRCGPFSSLVVRVLCKQSSTKKKLRRTRRRKVGSKTLDFGFVCEYKKSPVMLHFMNHYYSYQRTLQHWYRHRLLQLKQSTTHSTYLLLQIPNGAGENADANATSKSENKILTCIMVIYCWGG